MDQKYFRDILKNGYSEVVSGEASFRGCSILRLNCGRRWGGQDGSSAGGKYIRGLSILDEIKTYIEL